MFVRKIGRTIITLALVSTATLVPQPQSNAVTQGPFYIVGHQSRKCVDIPRSSNANNVVSTIYTCHGRGSNQEWDFVDTTGNYKRIRSRSSGKCLTVLNASTARYARVIQYTCGHGLGDNAEWRPERVYPQQVSLQSVLGGPANPDWYQLRNRRSGMCLTVLNASTSNSAPLMQYPCEESSRGNSFWTWFYSF